MDDGTFIPFFTDYGFRATFGNEKLDEFAKHALPLLVGREVPLKQIERLPAEITPDTLGQKVTRLDLLCTDEDGDIYLMEMQLAPQLFFFHRLMLHGFRQFVKQFNRGDKYHKAIKTVYSIGISYKDVWPEKWWYDKSQLRNEHGVTRSDKIVFITIELEKFDRQVKEPKTPLEELVFMIKHLQDFDSLKELPHFALKAWMREAFEELEKARMTPDQRIKAEDDLVWLFDMLTTEEQNKHVYEERIAKAEEKAAQAEAEKARMEEQAAKMEEQAAKMEEQAAKMEEQAAKVEQQRQHERIAQAKTMKTKGYPVEDIAEITGLAKEEIAQL